MWPGVPVCAFRLFPSPAPRCIRLEAVIEACSGLALLLYPRNVGLGDGVPCGHVLFHAGGEACLLALGERRAGLGDTALEAVLVEFLQNSVRWIILQLSNGTHLDQHARVLHGGFLLHLAHNLRLGVAAHAAHAAERSHVSDWKWGDLVGEE